MFNVDIRRRIRHFAPVVAAGVVGVVASIAVWQLTVASEYRAFVQEFTGRANNQAIIFQSGIDSKWEKLYAVRALFTSSDRAVTREEFESFTNSLLNGDPAILNISWIPRVKREERAAHELAAAGDGVPDYHIRAVGADGSLPVSPEREEYFPKFYSTLARNSPVYGIDLNDGGTAEQWITRTRDGDILSSSALLPLFIGQGNRRGFFAGVPVYARGLPHVMLDDRRNNLRGFVQGVFQVEAMIDAILANVKTPVRVYLFGPDAALDDLPVYFKSRLGDGSIAARSRVALAAGLHRAYPISFGDIEWTLVVTPEAAGIFSAGHERSTIVLLCGLLLSAGLTSFTWAMRRANDRFAKQNVQFDAALSNMMQGILMYDADGKLIISNRRFAELIKVPREKWERAALGTTVFETVNVAYELTRVTDKNPGQGVASLQKILSSRSAGSVVYERTDGRTFHASCVPMVDGGLVVTFEDITERRRAEEEIAHLARHDALTDLPNRKLFYEKMDDLLVRAPRNRPFAVFSLDLDRFKSVNDTLGHPIGDKLLQAVAERMRGCVRESDIVARLGGDEFAIVQVTFEQPADATALAARLIDAVSAPYLLDDHQVVVGASIGIAIAPADGTNPDQLMKNADLALYRCKADGGNTYRFFEAEMDARMQERRSIELDLRKALVNGEFTLDYQPIVNLKTGKVTACEALIRWHQPERGWVPPLEFISVAEETGLIGQIGGWALRRACADAAEWPDDSVVAVNVSPGQFKSADFAQVVKNALETSRLPANRLELEITELVLMQDDNAVLTLLHQLKSLGVSIAMDDFGTGYSSLGYLRSFPFDRIKIDQSFIQDLAKSKDSLAILRAVVGLGRSLDIFTTAEGVETQGQLEVLRTEGCTEAQGFFFSRPISPAEMKDLLVSLNGRAKAVA